MSRMPTWEEFMIPTLQVMADGTVRTRRDVRPLVADALALTDDQRQQALASGEAVHENRMGWALSFLTNVGALSRPSRGHYTITEAGRQLIELFPDGARVTDLKALADEPTSPIRPYVATVSRTPQTPQTTADSETLTPTEQVQVGVQRIYEEVAAELLIRLQGKEFGFFEDAVVRLLLKMGYGGSTGRGSVTQLSHDGGIDGVIDQDVLGLARVYVQAKRYADDNVVQRPDVQGFVGALSGKADSGVFITTSRFSEGARAYADGVPARIILVDGKRLTDLMIRFGVGVQVRETYHIVEIDEDFFA
ncbi:restriction endonuclease [Nocardioides rotundus]|uniref:restriction endonuclease n=1 Tax=Nocardioides rotundus TaxID=1774216 RepID=UPI001CBD0F97|nr:restriction endonuclease [Nocardioides rotundus]UAL30158.1 restriction endonuclease [Nocardioides rotundus]